jgi:C-terminal processing protease CtpA/Prc
VRTDILGRERRTPIPSVTGNPHAPNWDFPGIRARLTEVLLERPPHLVGRIGDIGYALLGAWSKEGFGDVEAALDRLADARALVIDVRGNGGGDERLAWRIAGRFAGERTAYGYAQARDPTLPGRDGFLERFAKAFDPLPGRERDPRRVAVLQGPYCVSSTEWFLLMMGALDGVTTLGLRSRGATGNPQPFELFPTFVVHVPTQRGFTLAGEPIEGRGIPPDVEVAQGEPGTDAALERALDLLRAP